ncbi:hypothetical protein [Haliscomenobacter hydrossis]|uniref:Uncharacterized protein n=1 Tax=Haliscomenobacter hydrossis (strain ATCC 27775 / DSM 1100 / LMG 10767 / O) TaxID=760192 RepID=F4KUI7_HALH1|nr:hypothetical protein [Haliscomenobacter hydrossis]AEE52423.1 hypothetical protein Halhy_4584 [Haliscomenobacter hydrossis DSM 1100]
MKPFSRFSTLLLFSLIGLISVKLAAQSQLAGTWYANGRADLPCSIAQQGNNLVFTINNTTSNGYFSSANTIFATQWNTTATLTTGGQGLLWNNQLWTRSQFSGFVSLQGTWGLSTHPQEQYSIEQDNMFIILTHQGKKLIGYFTSTHTITIPEWNNAVATVSADGASLSWNNQVWSKKTSGTNPTGTGTTTPPITNSGTTEKLCRPELSTFYFAAQSLGTVWGRMATEPAMLTADAVAACDAALSNLDATLGIIQCIVFDRGRIRMLRGALATTATQRLIPETESIIRDLQAVVQNLRLSCDNNVHISALYVGGIHLGAAQAWASSRQCMPTPMPAAIQGVIQNHLTTASNALTPYAACLPQFDFSGFGQVNLGSMNSILPHTQITGMETQLLWAIALSECCCTCAGSAATGSTGSDCDAACESYCKSIGKQHGRFNGASVCLLGVVSGGNSSGCDCW